MGAEQYEGLWRSALSRPLPQSAAAQLRARTLAARLMDIAEPSLQALKDVPNSVSAAAVTSSLATCLPDCCLRSTSGENLRFFVYFRGAGRGPRARAARYRCCAYCGSMFTMLPSTSAQSCEPRCAERLRRSAYVGYPAWKATDARSGFCEPFSAAGSPG